MNDDEKAASEQTGAQKRREGRIKVREIRKIDVKYRFLSNEEEYQCEEIFQGQALDLSRGGVLIEGVIPDPSWVQALLDEQIKVGMFIYIPQADAVKALGAMRWSQPVEGSAPEENRYVMGIRFDELDEQHKKALGKFLISFTLTKKKIYGSGPR